MGLKQTLLALHPLLASMQHTTNLTKPCKAISILNFWNSYEKKHCCQSEDSLSYCMIIYVDYLILE